MKTISLSLSHTLAYPLFHTIIILSIVTAFCLPSNGQSITQPAQIAWGRYFDDSIPGSHFDKEDLGDRIYNFQDRIYFVGRSKSDSLYPTVLGNTTPNPDGDAFVACYNPVCQTYNWIRYFGGPTSEEYAYCAAFDKVGNNSYVYIAGEVNEGNGKKTDMLHGCAYDNFGCSTVFQVKPADKKEAFIAKYNAVTGELLRWTYIGGKGLDQILSMEVDTVSHILYFAGYSESPTFLTYSNYSFTPYKGDFTGEGKMMFGGFDSCLNTLEYFSYYGGNGNDRAHDLAILYANNTRYLVMSGTSQSHSGVVPSHVPCIDSTYGGGKIDFRSPDAFLIIWDVNTLSSAPNWATYWGGSGIDRGRGVSITSSNEIYFTGQTLSRTDTGIGATFITTADAYMPEPASSHYDAFVTKFKIDSFNVPMGVHVAMNTFLGGDEEDYAKFVLAYHSNNASNGTDTVVVAGLTYSADMYSTDSNAYFLSKEINGNGKTKNRDAFLAVLTKDPANPAAKQKLSSFAYLGGQNDETDIKLNGTLVQKSYNPGLALGPNGSVYIVYTTKGTKTKIDGNIPVEYGAFHPAIDSGAKPMPDVYFAQVFPFVQHFTPTECTESKNETTITNPVKEDVISFYPVPFANITMMNILANQPGGATVSIYNVLGRKIIEKIISLHAGNNKIPFDFSAYPSGMYMSKVMVDGSVYQNKITKQE